MKSNPGFRQIHMVVIEAIFFLVFLFPATIAQSQTPSNFSGKWQFEKTKSSPDLLESTYDGTVILQIRQSSTTIVFNEIWKKAGEPDFKTATVSYTPDGKEKIVKHDIGTEKKSAKWSQDKKDLTITNLDTQKLKGVLKDFLVVDTYSLSDAGRTLTINRSTKNPVQGERTAKKVYNRK